MSKSKQKGTSWETAIVNYLKEKHLPAKRLALAGAEDKGDLELLDFPWLIVEAKNVGRYNIPGWIEEAKTEAKNADAEVGVVWMHRNGKSSPADGFVIMDGTTFVRLLTGILEGVIH